MNIFKKLWNSLNKKNSKWKTGHPNDWNPVIIAIESDIIEDITYEIAYYNHTLECWCYYDSTTRIENEVFTYMKFSLFKNYGNKKYFTNS
jgi:hypothetical protein